ncbi:MAG: AAA family ATPase [Bacteroidales bacterium]|nr:AAA family ATPase [Bacteroidales bacterium]
MRYTSNDYEQFLNTEFETKQRGFDQVINIKAITLKDRGDVFVGLFQKIDNSGMAIFKVRNSENMPRKNSFWTAVDLRGEKGDMSRFKDWGDLSWCKLRDRYQCDYSECFCAWIAKAEDPSFCLIGIKNLTMDFAKYLEPSKTIIAFGPQDPPLQYLINLLGIVKDKSCKDTHIVLDYDETIDQWHPQLIKAKTDFTSLLLNEMQNNNCVVVQGPPGTGKTHKMAELAAKLLDENKSVLVTALTNQALMELAMKDAVQPFLLKGKVSKTSLTIDENKELPKLQNIKDNLCNATPGNLSLATFYLSSGWAKDASYKPFDYVIMDEASQAFLPMIAAAMKLGEKLVFIGDQNQLAPIVETNEDIVNSKQWWPIVKGFETICQNFNYKAFLLCETFRLTQRGAESTGIFYNNTLQSVAETQTIPTNIGELNIMGGPMFVGFDLKVGDKKPEAAFEYIFNLTKRLYDENPKTKIAILSKFKDTIRQLQKWFVMNWGTKELPNEIRIETVDRIQGLTVDYCFFLIPNTSICRSLEKEFFNVATSRAKYNTIIVADKLLLKENMPEEVRKYLLKAQEDKFATFQPTTITSGNISINVVDKMDLSKFERKRKEIVEGKENIYIIDTNVFVNCPDIITRIGNKYKIVIPAKVLEELDKLKLKEEVDKKKLNEAAKNINTAFIKHFSQMEEANLSLLPKGFDRHNPDCMILSVALKYKEENPILLTSDNMLQSRASGLGITTVSLKDFLREIRM